MDPTSEGSLYKILLRARVRPATEIFRRQRESKIRRSQFRSITVKDSEESPMLISIHKVRPATVISKIVDKRLKASHDAFRSFLKGSIIRHIYNLLLHEFNTQFKIDLKK